MAMKMTKAEYQQYVAQKAQKSPLLKDTACAFLIGGGISETKEVWAQELENRYRHQVGDCMQKTKIVYASMGNDAALLGAAKFGFELLEHLSSEEGQK